MTSYTNRAPTSSPLQNDNDNGDNETLLHLPPPSPLPLFTHYPPMFVLPTHLTLEELLAVEESLSRLEATLTYDASEARIFLGTIVQRKRAALELRSRGVWSVEEKEEKGFSSDSDSDAELAGDGNKHKWGIEESTSIKVKKPRLMSAEGEEEENEHEDDLDRNRRNQEDIIELRSAESASSRATSRTQSPVLHEPRQQRRHSRVDMTEDRDHDQNDSNSIVHKNHVKVVRLEWLTQSIKARRALNINDYLVYYGKLIARPEESKPQSRIQTKTYVAAQSAHRGEAILARAIGDASSRPAPFSNRPGFPSSFSRPGGSLHHRHPAAHSPPTLHRQTTSENDEATPIPPAPDWVKNGVMYACMRSAPLHPPNEAFINQLIKIRKIRELTLDEIGVRAYSTSIAAIAAYPYELRSTAEVLSLPGCDTKIANLFVEFRNSDSARLEAAEALDTDPVLSIIHQFHKIWGVGPKTAREFYYQRHWRDLDDVIEHGWNSLSRVQQIGLKYYDEFLAGVPRSEVSGIAKTIHRHAQKVRPGCDYDGQGIECILVGGYRRGKELQGDIDLILSHRDERVTKNLVFDIVGSLEDEGWITHTLSLNMTTSHREQQTLPFRGDAGSRYHFDTLDKALVVWQDPHFEVEPEGAETEEPEIVLDSSTAEAPSKKKKKVRNPNPHRRVDIIISPWRTVGCAVLGWSGDTTFERDLRRYAKKRHGWKFDSSGVRERTTGGNVIDLERNGSTWEERERSVMEGLGVGWRPASERCTR